MLLYEECSERHRRGRSITCMSVYKYEYYTNILCTLFVYIHTYNMNLAYTYCRQYEFIIYILYILHEALRGVQCDAGVADVLHMCPHATVMLLYTCPDAYHACVLRQVPGSGWRIVIGRWHGNSSRNSSSKSRKSEKSRFSKRTCLNI
jgi:hypothetical protein